MVVTRSKTGLDVVLDAGRTFFHQKRHQMRRAWARNNTYHKTYHALWILSDRNLQDLGIPRNSIKSRAMEAANGL